VVLWMTMALAGDLDVARSALRRGDCAQTLAVLSDDAGLDAAMMAAACGRTDRLEAALEQGGLLEPYARLLLAREFIETEPARAETVLSGVDLTGAAGDEVTLLRARAQVAQGRSLEARDALRGLLKSDHGAEARWWLARGAEDRGDIDAAVEVYATLWTRHVTSPWSAEAGARMEALGRGADLETSAGRALALARAKALLKAWRAREAVAIYDAISAVTGDTSARWTRQVGMALFDAKDYPRAVETLGRLGPLAGTSDVEVLYHYALALSRTGDYDAAAVGYARLVELFPGTKRADSAQFKLGYLPWDEGDLEAALPKFEAYLAKHPTGKHADEAKWFLGWGNVRLGNDDDARRWLDAVVADHARSSLTPGALYWKARLAGRAGDSDAERAALQRVVNGYPASGHAWFAAQALGMTFVGVGFTEAPELPQAFVDQHPGAQEGLALFAAGQADFARERLGGLTGAAKAAGKDTALAYAHLLVSVGAYGEAQKLARAWCGKPWSGGDPVALAACYPRPEAPIVSEAASDLGLDPLLPYAIMTAESALKPWVTSSAGARGLMQLMPTLGEELHGELLGDGAYDPDLLYRAGYNAWLGTTELGQLRSELAVTGLDPLLPAVIAAYNGGSEAVLRWLGEYDAVPDADSFAENISYTETRRYVRRVLGFLMTYRWVYGDV